MMVTTENNSHQPGAINPTGEIIRVMTQHGTYLVMHNGPRRDRYTPPGTPERFPSSSQGYQRNTYGSPRSGQYHPSQYRDYRRSPQRSDDSNWRTSPRRDNQRYHSPPPPPRTTQGFKGSSDSTMRPSSMGEKSNVTFSDSVKSLN